MTEALISIDQGGQSSRVIAFDEDGRRLAGASIPVGTRKTGRRRYEQDPEELIRSIRSALDTVLASLPAGTGKRAGIATQRSSIVCWDAETGEALSPVISWRDTRHSEWMRSLGLDAERIHRLTGLRPSPHYGASKIRWCLDELPAVAEARRRGRLLCGPLASFLVFRLTRENTRAADPVNASRTLLWDIGSGEWSTELLGLFDLPAAILPPILPGDGHFGHVAVAGSSVPLVRCTGDQSAAVYAGGEPASTSALVNAGTGAFVQRLVGEPQSVDRLLLSVARHDRQERRYALEGTVNGAGCALEAEARRLGIPDWPATVESVADDGADVPVFLNGESGLGSPWWRDDFPSRFVGDGDGARCLLAVAESIVFMVSENLHRMRAALGPETDIVITGGLARSDGFCRRLASLNDIPVRRPEAKEATAGGLAWLMGGRDDPWPEPGPGRTFSPQPAVGLRRRYGSWRRLMDEAVGLDAV
jgi:glycerol kinase